MKWNATKWANTQERANNDLPLQGIFGDSQNGMPWCFLNSIGF
jgi:hypothetical protein